MNKQCTSGHDFFLVGAWSAVQAKEQWSLSVASLTLFLLGKERSVISLHFQGWLFTPNWLMCTLLAWGGSNGPKLWPNATSFLMYLDTTHEWACQLKGNVDQHQFGNQTVGHGRCTAQNEAHLSTWSRVTTASIPYNSSLALAHFSSAKRSSVYWYHEPIEETRI